MSEPKAKGAKPTHLLKVKDPKTNTTSVVGVAWVSKEGFFSIKLNAHVVLSEVDLRECFISMYPNGYDVPARNIPTPLTGWESEVPE